MIKIAIIEDEKDASDRLSEMLDRYSSESGTEFNISVFENSVMFLSNYKPIFDIVFMDIELPFMDGMTAAHKLRELDKEIVLIFITNMVQYAVTGYEVDALDFIVKPVVFGNFSYKLGRALSRIAIRNSEPEITVKQNNGLVRLRASDISYIETMEHRLLYHVGKKQYDVFGSLKNIEKTLAPYGFIRASHCYLINLKFVTAVNKYIVTVSDTQLQISHPKRKAFMQALSDYLGGIK